MDISWISTEAKTIHTFFVSIFYMLSTLLILVGVLIEYFKIPIGGMPAFSQLIGRALVAAILLAAYPEISNTVAAIADSISERIGSLNTFQNVMQTAGAALKERSLSWSSLGDTLLSVVSYIAYFVLYITVFFFDAAIVYCLVLLYIFSPVLIAFYILPQTSSLTTGLFRTLFEIATWKIVWCVLGTLLWSTALNNFRNGSQGNFITLLALTLMLAFSIVLTPIVVRNLISGTVSNIAAQTAGLAAVGLSAGILSPAAMAASTKAMTKWTGKTGLKMTGKIGRFGYKGAKGAARGVRNRFTKRVSASTPESEQNPTDPS